MALCERNPTRPAINGAVFPHVEAEYFRRSDLNQKETLFSEVWTPE